jgi:CRP-like cAMP-binding protein
MPRHAFKGVIEAALSLKLQEHANLLERVPTLGQCIDASLFGQFASILEEVCLLEEDNVCVQGEDKGTLFLIYDGEVVLENGPEAGRVLKKGDWLGEQQLDEDLAAACTATVRTASATVLMVGQESFAFLRQASKAIKNTEKSGLFTFGQKRGIELFRCAVKRIASKNRIINLFRMSSWLSASPSCSEAFSKQASDALDVDLKNCEVVGALGEGTFGLVLLLRDKQLEREYAIKALHKPTSEGEKKEHEVSLNNERRMLGRLTGSDFVVRLHGCFELEFQLPPHGVRFRRRALRRLYGQKALGKRHPCKVLHCLRGTRP